LKNKNKTIFSLALAVAFDMRAGINRYRNHFQEDERKQKGAVGVVVNITPDTQTDTKWNRPNQKETEEKNPHNLLGGVYTRSEFIHTYYDEGTRILKREIIRETLFRVVARQQQRRRHIPMRLHNNYSMGSINTVSTLLHYCTHFYFVRLILSHATLTCHPDPFSHLHGSILFNSA
jgi:hypothetical protein